MPTSHPLYYTLLKGIQFMHIIIDMILYEFTVNGILTGYYQKYNSKGDVYPLVWMCFEEDQICGLKMRTDSICDGIIIDGFNSTDKEYYVELMNKLNERLFDTSCNMYDKRIVFHWIKNKKILCKILFMNKINYITQTETIKYTNRVIHNHSNDIDKMYILLNNMM
jgi:hypothetical protein